MREANYSLSLALAVIFTTLPVATAVAAENGTAKFAVGVFGQRSDYHPGDSDDYGVEVAWGNKMTGGNGFISSLGTYLGWGEIDGADLTLAGAGLDMGWRFGLGGALFLDLLGGIGYDGLRAEFDDDIDLTLKSFYLKPAIALGTHLTPNDTLRLEIGSRYTFDGSLDTNTDEGDFDLEKGNNFYTEAAWLNRALGLPLQVGLYYKRSDFDFEGDRLETLERDETGVKLAILF